MLNLTGIAALRGKYVGDGLRLGCSTNWSEIAKADLPDKLAGLQMAAKPGGLQVQNVGTLGGGSAICAKLGGGRTIVASAMNSCLGACQDIPPGHINAAYLRSDFGATTVTIARCPPRGPVCVCAGQVKRRAGATAVWAGWRRGMKKSRIACGETAGGHRFSGADFNPGCTPFVVATAAVIILAGLAKT